MKARLETNLYVTQSIPKDAAILLVDMQQKYFDEVLDELDVTKRKSREERLSKRLTAMAERSKSLRKDGVAIYAIVDEDGIHPNFEGIPTGYLPHWRFKHNPGAGDSMDPAHLHILHPEIIFEMKAKDNVVVCGLWKEICVLSVTRLMQKEGIQSLLYSSSDLTLENAIIWEEGDTDVITLESECEDIGINIIELN